MPLTGEAKREWQRGYRKRLRQIARPVTQAIRQAVDDSRSHEKALQRSSQVALGLLLQQQGLPITRVLDKLSQRMESKRYFNGVEDRGGKICRVTITADDGDAQLRATEAVIGLHERAGTIPSGVQASGGAASLHYHLHLDDLSKLNTPDVVDITPNKIDANE